MGDSPEAMRQQSDEFITALYRVWKIDHTFENGQLLQITYGKRHYY